MKPIEYLDLVDENDNVTSKEDRNVIYEKGLNNFRTVNVFVLNPIGDILMTKRDSKRRIFPGCFDFSCGEHVESGEDYFSAAKRGLSEELNIMDSELIFVTRLTPKDNVSSFMGVFKIIHDKPINPSKAEGVESYDFYSFEKIKNMIKEDRTIFKGDMPRVFELIEDILYK